MIFFRRKTPELCDLICNARAFCGFLPENEGVKTAKFRLFHAYLSTKRNFSFSWTIMTHYFVQNMTTVEES